MSNLTKKQLRAIHAKNKSKYLSSVLVTGVIRDAKTPVSQEIGVMGIPKAPENVIDITTNKDNKLTEYPKKDFKLWIVNSKHEKIPQSETVVRSQHYGQAVDDFIITWNKQKRMGMTIGYPVIQGETV